MSAIRWTLARALKKSILPSGPSGRGADLLHLVEGAAEQDGAAHLGDRVDLGEVTHLVGLVQMFGVSSCGFSGTMVVCGSWTAWAGSPVVSEPARAATRTAATVLRRARTGSPPPTTDDPLRSRPPTEGVNRVGARGRVRGPWGLGQPALSSRSDVWVGRPPRLPGAAAPPGHDAAAPDGLRAVASTTSVVRSVIARARSARTRRDRSASRSPGASSSTVPR